MLFIHGMLEVSMDLKQLRFCETFEDGDMQEVQLFTERQQGIRILHEMAIDYRKRHKSNDPQ